MMSLSKRLLKNLIIENYKPLNFEDMVVNQDYNIEEQSELNSVTEAIEGLDINQLIELKREIDGKIENLAVLERETYEKGYLAGEKDGYEMGIKKAETVIDQLDKLIDELKEIKEKWILENNKKIVALSIAIAKKIIEKEITESPEAFLTIISNAIKKIERQEKLKLTINPAMQETINRFRKEWLESYSKIVVDIDPHVSKDFVKIESETEEIIINFDEEIYEISKKLSELI